MIPSVLVKVNHRVRFKHLIENLLSGRLFVICKESSFSLEGVRQVINIGQKMTAPVPIPGGRLT